MKLQSQVLLSVFFLANFPAMAGPRKPNLDQRIQRVALSQIDYDASLHPIGFAGIQLRHNGHWNEAADANQILKRLDAESLATIASYLDFGLESLAADSEGRFVARVSFAYGREKQINVVAGQVVGPNDVIAAAASGSSDPTGSVVVTKYADVDQSAVGRREDLMVFDNIFNPNRNFQAVKEQVQAEDKARAGAAEAIIRAWLATSPSNALIEASAAAAK